MCGQFENLCMVDEINMVELSVCLLVALTKLFGKDVVCRKSGCNASILSFLPFPYYSVYSAKRAFVLAYSETTAVELEGTAVLLITLCLGAVETPFHSDIIRKTNAMSANKLVPANVVDKTGVDLFLIGRGKKIVRFMNWLLTNFPRVTLDFVIMKIKKNFANIQA
jgi:uncharacterized protein